MRKFSFNPAAAAKQTSLCRRSLTGNLRHLTCCTCAGGRARLLQLLRRRTHHIEDVERGKRVLGANETPANHRCAAGRTTDVQTVAPPRISSRLRQRGGPPSSCASSSWTPARCASCRRCTLIGRRKLSLTAHLLLSRPQLGLTRLRNSRQ